MAAKKKKSLKKKSSKTKKSKAKVRGKKIAAKKKAPRKTLRSKGKVKAASKKKTSGKAKKKVAKVAQTKAPSPKVAPVEIHPLLGVGAPDLEIVKQDGERLNLKNAVESQPQVILYFYPKDDTPGCTTEACNFRDNMNRLRDRGVVVYGVSPDSPESHQRFIEKHGLNFDLISDENKELASAFQVWKEKNFMGRSYMGVERSTFLFQNGKIVKAWQPVRVEGHVDEVLESL